MNGIKNYSNIVGGGKALFALQLLKEHPLVLVSVAEEYLPVLQNNLTALIAVYPFTDAIPLHFLPPAQQKGHAGALAEIAISKRGLVLTDTRTIGENTISAQLLNEKSLTLNTGTAYKYEELLARLTELGFERAEFVEDAGQFSRRGEILDVWAPGKEMPWRVVFGFNTVESIREFDAATQLSGNFHKQLSLYPLHIAAESGLEAYVPAGSAIYIDSAVNESIAERFSKFPIYANNPLTGDAIDAGFRPCTRWEGKFALFAQDLARAHREGMQGVICCANEGERERLEDLLATAGVEEGAAKLSVAPLDESFYAPALKRAYFSAQEILYKRKPVSFPKFKSGRRLETLWEISAGDFVVHEKYGIGRYQGLKRIARGDQEKEYLMIEYKHGDRIYVPPEDFRVVQKYVGTEGHRPRLYSIDTSAWEKAKTRAKAGAEKMANELLKLYAGRQTVSAPSFSTTAWERELADSFRYDETEDQVRAIEEVNRDLESPKPMERLICGDVGFGKTEVAIRAAFKVATNSAQVAILVPTTVLAEQHYNTFSDRMASFPVKVAFLSRFQGKDEQAAIIAGIKDGSVDIVIGTHRLLSKDISFKNLGLLIIDEEHRFGVKQKEKIKALKQNVHILLLSATPIPRTLSFAMANLRDLSLIETPPYGRLPIETHMSVYDEKVVKNVIEAELSRGGQVYYVHNRVQTIIESAAGIKKMVPHARVGVVHGQLSATQIEEAMYRFMHNDLDVLVASTIIESGLDIPSANTMIIEEAEDFGLAQLYQLRGRIGREKQKAYCYLFFSKGALSENASKRLQALYEFSELGSGFRLALRDTEIRGAGNILGAEQHGFVKEVGFELFSRLLAEASPKIRAAGSAKGTPEDEFTPELSFQAPALLPADYIEGDDIRISFYRRLATVRTPEDLAKIRYELTDRFGTLPQPAENLLTISDIRIIARNNRIAAITESDEALTVYLSNFITLDPENIVKLGRDYSRCIEYLRGDKAGVRFKKDALGAPLFQFMKEFLLKISKYAIISQ